MRGVVLVLLLLGPGVAHAQLKLPTRPLPEAGRLHVGSWHDHGDYDNANLGLGATWQGGLTAGIYHNSFGKASGYAGMIGNLITRRAIQVDVMLGAITGYSESAPILPVAVPVLGARVGRSTLLQVIYMPASVMPGNANVFHFMIDQRFVKRND